MVWTLAAKKGKPLTEQAMAGRPGYRGYVEATGSFVPWPPKGS